MRIVVVSASGRVGGAVLRELVAEENISKVVSIEHEGQLTPSLGVGEHAWHVESLDREVARPDSDLTEKMRYADVAVYLGWPGDGSPVGGTGMSVFGRWCKSAAESAVSSLVCLLSVGAYSSAPPGQVVDESWPTQGIGPSALSLELARAERLLDSFVKEHERVRVVRLRAGLIVPVGGGSGGGWRAAIGQRVGEKTIAALGATSRRGLVPGFDGSLQLVHADDVARAVRTAVIVPVSGAFNLVTEAVDSSALAPRGGAHRIPVPSATVLRLVSLGNRAGILGLDAERIRVALAAPVVDGDRARRHLLGGGYRHAAGAMVEAVTAERTTGAARHSAAPRDELDVGASERATREERRETGGEPRVGALYERALDYFGRLVHCITDSEWTASAGYRDWTVWRLVSVVAIAQHRTAMQLQGEPATRIDAELPDDPLGYERASGWDAAADLARAALEESEASRDGSAVTAGQLADVITDVVLLGSCLGEAIGASIEIDPLLHSYVREHMKELTSV